MQIDISRWQNVGQNGETQADFLLTNGASSYPDTTVMSLRSNGNVGIANTSPSYILDVTGEARFTGGYTTSDQRWKKNITPVKNALATIEGLQGVNFDWRRDEFPKMNFTKGRQFGFIAQDVEKILPEIVSTDHEGYKNVSYESVTPVLVEAVKELKADQASLRESLSSAQASNDNLAAELKAANDNLAAEHTADAKAIDELRHEVEEFKRKNRLQ
jgi:hypothetical protein